MRVKAWSNGKGVYGIRVGAQNRAEFFNANWEEIEVEWRVWCGGLDSQVGSGATALSLETVVPRSFASGCDGIVPQLAKAQSAGSRTDPAGGQSVPPGRLIDHPRQPLYLRPTRGAMQPCRYGMMRRKTPVRFLNI